MSTHILYKSSNGNIVLLDLPRSIEEAQASSLHVKSISPLEHPWPSTEPKGAKLVEAEAAIDPAILIRDTQLQAEIELALKEVNDSPEPLQLPWCLNRNYEPPPSRTVPARSKFIETRSTISRLSQIHYTCDHDTVPLILSPLADANQLSSLTELQNTAVFNPHTKTINTILPESTYTIPPSSCFILATIQSGLPAFHSALTTLPLQKPSLDLILMDPPWPNRSVRHSKAYLTTESQYSDPFLQTLPIISSHLHQNGTVAIWVTNKAAIRTQVLTSFTNLGLYLHAEWIWTKVTTQGEPVTALNGIWRKPYETLLLFKYSHHISYASASILTPAPTRKFIFAVPDAHSRKPSFKRLFEEFLPLQYRALELFARSLTAGWWAWGDEVLKFQNVNEWTDP